MNNKKIRKTLEEHGMKQWELAELLGIHEGTLTRKLRHELSETEQIVIINLIIRESERRKDQQLREELERRKNA